jgi:hypothetical protein
MSPEAGPARSASSAVVGSRDLASLLRDLGHPGLDAAEAVSEGIVVRQKVEGFWLFAPTDNSLEVAAHRVLESVMAVCASWLIAPVPPLINATAARVTGVSRDAIQAHIRACLRRGDLGGLPLLTQQYQPYFAAFRPADQPEIHRQVAALKSHLDRMGHVRVGDLPEPERPPDFRAWRSNLLQHAEFLGLGRIVDGVLVAWSR